MERRVVNDGDQRWQIRHITSQKAEKLYRCPGCDHLIQVGHAHIVAWDDDGDGDDRRHWHKGCWNARKRRSPGFK